MNFEEFATWTGTLVEAGRLDPDQAGDVLRQREIFDQERAVIEREFAGLVVGFVADERVVAERAGELLDRVTQTYRDERQVYFEWIASPMAIELFL